MSPSPGNGRLSVSPGPSQRSSNTLRSRNSRGSGEESSRGTQDLDGRGPGTIDLSNIRNRSKERPISSGYLGDDLVNEQDFGSRRRKKPRSSGGFLLDSTFDSTPERDSPRNGNKALYRQDHSPASRGSKKGKEKVHQNGMNGSVRRPARHVERSVSPLPDVYDGSSPSNGSRPSRETPRISLDESEPSSSLSPQHGRFSSDREDDSWHQSVTHPAAVDSAQLVQMALALSDSRRRQTSGAHLPPPSTSMNRRATNAGMSALQGSIGGYAAGGSLKRYLNEQRRISRNISPSHGRSTPPGRHVSTAYGSIGPLDVGIGQPRINMSDRTLSRVEKARAYIEMRSHYMRLLDNLPPLKPDATADGNIVVQTSSVPGGTVQMKRMQSHRKHQHELGRQYNPLQVIRDRKLRARIRKPCNPDLNQWTELDPVVDWVDEVESVANASNYREEDRVNLPQFYINGELNVGLRPSSGGHQRVESSATGKFKRPRTDWYIGPEELFADAYWLEQGNHKGMVEDSHGNIIFPGYASTHQERPESSGQQRQQQLEPPSTQRDATMSTESITTADSNDTTDVDDAETSNHRGRRRLFHRNREQSPSALRQLWQKRKDRSPSSDGLSETDDEREEGRPKFKRRPVTSDDNTGPLERHMNSIIENMDHTGSPELASPGTPEKWGKGNIDTRMQHDASGEANSAKTPESTPPRMMVHGENADRRRAYPTLDTAFESSMDESSVPNSPVTSKRGTKTAANGSPSRDSSNQTAHRRKLPFLHHRNKDTSRLVPQDPYAADESDARSSRQPSAENEVTRTSLEAKRRPEAQHIIHSRTNDSLASSTSGRNRDEKEASSAVSRFFKGGRVGDLIRGERPDFAWRKEPLPEEVPPSSRSSNYESESANEDPISKPHNGPPNGLSRTTTSSSWASKAIDRHMSNKPRYHVEGLPTFKTSQQQTSASQNTTDKVRSPRFNRLRPLRTDTNGLSRTSTRDKAYDTSSVISTGNDDGNDRRTSYGFLNPNYIPNDQSNQSADRLATILAVRGSVGRGGPPPTGLTNVHKDASRKSSQSPATRPMLDGHRHWSISDPSTINRQRSRSAARSSAQSVPKAARSTDVVSKVDIERVRALLLCTGIKAHTMNWRASEVRPHDKVGQFLRNVAASTGKELVPVQRKQEHVLAARMLVEDCEASVERLRQLAERFSDTKTKQLARDLDRLKQVAQDELTERSRHLGDEAGRISLDVTSKGTRDVQSINEAVQALVRARRRRMRWVRRLGWGTVEWLLLGVMWWVWLIVVVIRTILRVFGFAGSTVRWLFFL